MVGTQDLDETMEATKPYPSYPPGPCVLAYRASRDVPRTLAQASPVCCWLTTPASTPAADAMRWAACPKLPLPRFMRHRTTLADLARDNTVSLSTAYRYLHEALDVLAAHAPELTEIVAEAANNQTRHLLLDGTPIATDRVHDRGRRSDRWCSGKRRHHGDFVQVVTDAGDRPLWVSPVEPGCTHDLTAARRHALPALHAVARDGVPTLADKGDTGAGAGIRVPVRRPAGGQALDPSTRGWNSCVNVERAFVEHGIAHLKTSWWGATPRQPVSAAHYRDRRCSLRPKSPGEPLLTRAHCVVGTSGYHRLVRPGLGDGPVEPGDRLFDVDVDHEGRLGGSSLRHLSHIQSLRYARAAPVTEDLALKIPCLLAGRKPPDRSAPVPNQRRPAFLDVLQQPWRVLGGYADLHSPPSSRVTSR